jgi:DNA-3-methyladenine glycosylase I
MPKTQRRCPWSEGVSDAYLRYHDEEWGVPVRDDTRQFEFLVLEGAQAGLSWKTILHRRDGYRRAFADFDVQKVARFTAKRTAFIAVQEEFGSFCDYFWRFVDGKPVQNRWREQREVPATSAVSDAISKDMKKRGFRFVGSTIIYAHLQATGLVNDHLVSCFRHGPCKALR